MNKFTNKQLLPFLLSLFLSSVSVAQSGLNDTQKKVFTEAKEIVVSNNNTLISILMILLVLVVVGIALYLSFKDDELKPTV